MIPLVDRYVYDVVRRLPEKSRPDVEKELRANIEDMMAGSTAEEDAVKTLCSLGDPAKLAEQYRQKPRYLISPAAFDDYVTVLKIVIPILAAVTAMIDLFSALLGTPSNGTYGQAFADILGTLLGSVWTAVTHGFLLVTLGFGLAEYYQVRKKREWTPESLPEIPSQTGVKISRAETIIGFLLSLLFLMLMTRYSSLLAWHGLTEPMPLFSDAALASYVPYLIALTACSFAVSCVKFYYGRWNYPTAAASGLNAVAWSAATILFLRAPSTFNPAFIAQAAAALKLDPVLMNEYWQRGILGLCILSLIGTAVDVISGFAKARKGRGTHDLQRMLGVDPAVPGPNHNRPGGQ